MSSVAPHPPGLGDGGEQLGPVVVLAALHFHIFGQQLRCIGDNGPDRGLLGFEPQPGRALLLSRHSMIRSVVLSKNYGRHDRWKSRVKTATRWCFYML